jgi:heme exporter protein D
VEHAAPGRLGVSARRLDHRSDDSDPAVADGGGIYAPVRDAAARGDAQRDFAAAGADAALAASERGRLTMQATAHIGFIVAAYGAGAVVIAALIAWVMLDYRLQRRILAELETKGVSRRSAREPAERMAGEDA